MNNVFLSLVFSAVIISGLIMVVACLFLLGSWMALNYVYGVPFLLSVFLCLAWAIHATDLPDE